MSFRCWNGRHCIIWTWSGWIFGGRHRGKNGGRLRDSMKNLTLWSINALRVRLNYRMHGYRQKEGRVFLQRNTRPSFYTHFAIKQSVTTDYVPRLRTPAAITDTPMMAAVADAVTKITGIPLCLAAMPANAQTKTNP